MIAGIVFALGFVNVNKVKAVRRYNKEKRELGRTPNSNFGRCHCGNLLFF